MTQGIHDVSVGNIRAMVVQEGQAWFPVTDLHENYVNADTASVEAALVHTGHEGERANSYMNALYLETGGVKILVDTGMGASDPGDAFNRIQTNLATQGVTPAEIDIVFITHFHGDHINGLTDENNVPVYENATIITSQVEWDYWMSEATIQMIGDERAQRYLQKVNPLKDRFNFVQDGDTVAEGISVYLLPGHTPGHAGLRIESEGEVLIHAVDLLHHAVQFQHPEWHHKFDTDKELAVTSRHSLLQQANDETWRVLFYHLPFPGVFQIRAEGDGFNAEAVV